MPSSPPSEVLCINSIRCLAAALPQAANSGHPGAPIGCAPIAHVLFGGLLTASSAHPDWINRDRFVLSNGHGCALHYTMLFLRGYKGMEIEDLKSFRQLNSRTPGHPESHVTKGVEVTTGPLGQGIAQAVGLAIASTHLSERYNKVDLTLFDNYIYTIVGDGCLQEGISSEASSLAGHLGLGRLICIYDSNKISIDGCTDLSFTEDVGARYAAYGWQVLRVDNGDSDIEELRAAVIEGQKDKKRPTLIIVKTTIGFGSLKEGSEKTHGSPLGVDDLKQMREKWGLPAGLFDIPGEVLEFYRKEAAAGEAAYAKWQKSFEEYISKYPKEGGELKERINGDIPKDLVSSLPTFTPSSKADSTRSLSGQVLNHIYKQLPALIGGSADLTGSNSSALKGESDFQSPSPSGRYIRFGVREHGMAAICNGLAAFGGFKPFGATFLNFISYAWGAVRLSAVSELGVLYIATHDSIELGEDGPTHQPIEMAALCRATPNLNYIRPADGNEVSAAYASWLSHPTTPTVLALCRGAVPHLPNTSIEGAMKGGYVVKDFDSGSALPKFILGSCGSELQLAVSAGALLKDTYNIRVVSLPCWDIFNAQPEEYREAVIPSEVQKSLYIEAANALGYQKYFKKALEMTTFGASGPKDKLWEHFGYTTENIVNIAKQMK